MARSSKVSIEIRKQDKHFALVVENQLVALVVYRKGAVVLDHLLRGCIKYSSRNLFREALKDALVAEETPEETTAPEKPQKSGKAVKPDGAATKSKAEKPKSKAAKPDTKAAKEITAAKDAPAAPATEDTSGTGKSTAS